MTAQPNVEPLVTVEEAARRLGISRRTAYSRIALGTLQVVRLGGRVVRVDPRDLERLIQAGKG